MCKVENHRIGYKIIKKYDKGKKLGTIFPKKLHYLLEEKITKNSENR